MKNKFFLLIIFLASFFFTKAQSGGGTINGNFYTVGQTYKADSLIGATATPEYLLLNTYANIYYHNGNFTAGTRYEGYFNTLQGYDKKNDGFGFPYRFAQYQSQKFDITVGNFYEQFGNGLIFRTYEDKNIGYDNAIDGLRVKFVPIQGIYFKALIGRQRYAFSKNNNGFSNVIYKGLVRGLDFEFTPNEIFKGLDTSEHQLLFGLAFVSKFQKSETQYVTVDDTTVLQLAIPENTAAFSGRFSYTFKNFSFSGEYAYKMQDPSADNNFIYKPGEALFLNFSYARSGLGILLSLLRIDNFSFRSDRNAALNDLSINYIPDITKNHTYSLTAMYPFASQNTAEQGVAIEFTKKFKRKTFWGGKYGTNISLNFSSMYDLFKIPVKPDIPIGAKGTYGYRTDFLKIGDLLYRDINFQITKKISRTFKFILLYQNLFFNYAVLRGKPEHNPVRANTLVMDFTVRFNSKKSLRTELQTLQTKDDMGAWAMILSEYSISPHWFFAISDEYNYGNPDKNLRAHYYNAAIAYKVEASRIQIGYGRQRAGIICIGGVCREVPAANGFNFTISTSF